MRASPPPAAVDRGKPRRLSLADFEQWVLDGQVRVVLPRPYRVVPCACGDCNCHGWRFVEAQWREDAPV